MFRRALVALKPERPNDVLISYATNLAMQYSLRLVGIAVLDKKQVAPPEPVPLGGMSFKIEKDAMLIGRAREQIEVQLRELSTRCRNVGVVCDEVSAEGNIAEIIAETVHRCDLLMIGHTQGFATGGGGAVPSPLHDIVKRCPRPVLVVPAHRPNYPNVLVAYDGSVQAARALEAFVASGWSRNAEVHVLAIAAMEHVAQQYINCAMDYLLAHGMNPIAQKKATSESPADIILRAAEESSAGLVVMGCYGQSAFREFIFGSVTRTVLNSATFPILLDH